MEQQQEATTDRLSVKQRQLLLGMRPNIAYSVPQLAAMLDTSAHGAVKTASSLVRRGRLHRDDYRGRVRYTLAEAAA